MFILVCDPWLNYTACTKTCGGGIQRHNRNCSFNDNVHNDTKEFTETRYCNTNPCPPGELFLHRIYL